MTIPESDGNEKTLTTFRQQIDALDDQIIDLLIERIGIVSRVGELKRSQRPGECPIRAGREAQMVRRIIEKFEGSAFDPAAAAAIWRILIGSSTCVESPLSLSVYAPPQNENFYWLAREYFGPTLAVTRQPHVNRVIGDVMDGKTSIGILPVLQSGDASDWWVALMRPEPRIPKIFAHIPFVWDGMSGKPAALAIARIQPEPTGDDISLIVLEADHNVSQNRLQTAFAQVKLNARWINIASPTTSTRRHLIEIQGFITLADAEMNTFLADLGPSVLNASLLGSYAVPAVLKSNQPSALAYASPKA